jgi:translation initiation factor 2 alpha subunit (eIF-2alpha)
MEQEQKQPNIVELANQKVNSDRENNYKGAIASKISRLNELSSSMKEIVKDIKKLEQDYQSGEDLFEREENFYSTSLTAANLNSAINCLRGGF